MIIPFDNRKTNTRTSSERLMYVQFTSCVYWDNENFYRYGRGKKHPHERGQQIIKIHLTWYDVHFLVDITPNRIVSLGCNDLQEKKFNSRKN